MSVPLNRSVSVTLNAAGNGTVSLGPGGGPPTWALDALLWQTTRPGAAPVPRIQIFIGTQSLDNLQAQSYDGSFGSASGSAPVSLGQNVIAVWTGGQAGDVATLVVTGTAG